MVKVLEQSIIIIDGSMSILSLTKTGIASSDNKYRIMATEGDIGNMDFNNIVDVGNVDVVDK